MKRPIFVSTLRDPYGSILSTVVDLRQKKTTLAFLEVVSFGCGFSKNFEILFENGQISTIPLVLADSAAFNS